MSRKRSPYIVTDAQVGQAAAHHDTSSSRSAMAAIEAGNKLAEQHIPYEIYYSPDSGYYTVRRSDGG
jgi:hypothetical protein